MYAFKGNVGSGGVPLMERRTTDRDMTKVRHSEDGVKVGNRAEDC